MHLHAKYFHIFNSFNEQIGPARFKKIISYFGSLEKAWLDGQAQDFIEAGLEEKLAQEIVLKRPHFDPDKEIEKLDKKGISILTILDETYPRLLKEIYDPPYILYIRGEFRPEDEFAIAIVGTRKLSPYGQQAAANLARELAQAGLTIVSGLAMGIDTLVHAAAVQQKARTIAVLGSAVDPFGIFPPVNRRLAEQITQNGVISEYPPGSNALKHHFPARNRIISGLALGTLVIEAPEQSGALITARHALEQNREVFAVPGSIYSENSLGPNNLIKMGAKLVANAQDILEELDLKSLAENIKTQKIVPDSFEEAQILALLSHEPLSVDKIVQETKLDTALISSTLSLMEMKGRVRNLGGMQYVLAR